MLQPWLRELGGDRTGPLFPTRRGTHLTRGAIWRLVVKHVATARGRCPSLATKNITPHGLRHTAAMRMLHAPTPIDTATIALWLGHETLDSTNKYIHADMALKQRALDRTTPPNAKPGRYRAPDPSARVPRESLNRADMSSRKARSPPVGAHPGRLAT